MSRILNHVPALLAFIFSAVSYSTSAQVTFSGPTATGTYVYYHQDVVIDGIELTGVPGSVFELIVYNGSITVGTGSTGIGIDGNGEPGVDGASLVPPGAGQPGTQGYSVHLETRICSTISGPEMLELLGVTSHHGADTPDLAALLSCQDSPGPRPMDISVVRPIHLRGGAGGDGANGQGGTFVNCSYVPAQSGFTAAAGQDGGNCTIIAAGNISVRQSIDTSGGIGGDGGNGAGGIIGPAGDGREGRVGGNGGSVTINHQNAPMSAFCTFSGGTAGNGGITTSGGNGGNGGDGAPGNGPSVGGQGGPGGTAGDVSFDVRDLAFNNSATPCLGTSVVADGGWGGQGGIGADGGKETCVENPCDPSIEYTVAGHPGSIAGRGGNGGQGGSISALITNDFLLTSFSEFSADGGRGGMSGQSGAGGLTTGLGCGGTEVDCNGFIALSAGQSMPGGTGGDAGTITVFGRDLVLGIYTGMCGPSLSLLSAEGGDGPDAVDAVLPGRGCCDDVPITTHGAQGGPGGLGGDGGFIQLIYTGSLTNPAGLAHFLACPGEGSDGGNGSEGSPPGAAGVAGSCGVPGSIQLNGFTNTPTNCGTCMYSDGLPGGPPSFTCGGS